MNQIPLATSSTIVPLANFWRSILLYHDRPNLVNRKITTVTQVLFCEVSPYSTSIKRISDAFTREALLYEIRKLPDYKSITCDLIKSILEVYGNEVVIKESTWEIFNNSFQGIFISIRVLMGRKLNLECPEIVIFDKKNKVTTFFAVHEQDNAILAPVIPYHIELTRENNLRFVLNSFEDADTKSAEWLADKLFPKLMKWAEHEIDQVYTIESLCLVAADEYYKLYHSLKAKYGKKLVEVWPQKANTNPKKYVYEDLAIATYLICLWHQLQCDDIYFVDCGCGNGLLVYVLNQEGYKGMGLDVRSRKLWELFPVDLEVEAVTPSSVFPQATWIIGNHSDELTPWIPVIASRSSPQTNFFVLPCCSYDFSGQKYVRMDTSKSQYNDYLEYIKTISMKCGFNTSVDKLRIPSTKRICLVGIRGSCDQIELDKINSEVTQFIDSKLNSDFVVRKSFEQVRNCTQLNRDLILRIVITVVDCLLMKKNLINKPDNRQAWNKGAKLTLAEIIQHIQQEDLKKLKNECGGLQTLLKNHRYIFEVKNGFVSLRAPLRLTETEKYRDKSCWFYKNHPDGCFFDDVTCAYKH